MSYKDIEKMLTEEEEILFASEQSRYKPGGSSLTPNTIFITTHRIIYKNPRMLGIKQDYEDFSYQDLANVKTNKGMFSTELVLQPRFNSDVIKIPAIGKKDAEKILGLIQRGIHGDYARQNIVQKVEIVQQQNQEQGQTIQNLEKAIAWREKGIITEDEFQHLKRKYLEV